MKLSTANFSMQRMIKTTILTWTIIIAVLLSVLASTTVKAEDITYTPEDPYVLAIWIGTGNPKIYISDGQFVFLTQSSNSTSLSASSWPKFVVINYTYAYKIEYSSDLMQWVNGEYLEASTDSTSRYRFGDSKSYGSAVNRYVIQGARSTVLNKWKDVHIASTFPLNSAEINILGSYSEDLNSLPHGITEADLRIIIDEQLNTSTESGQTAQTIINNTTTQYNLYLSGDIDSKTMLENVDENIDTLSDLTPSTLLDAMQINNGLTYSQTIQDQLLNTTSVNVQSMINGYTNTITNAVNNYKSGAVNQADTVTIIQQTITNLNNLITNGTAKTTADIAAVNAAINAANSSMDSVTGYKDLDTEVSDKVQQSDEEEIEYLEELTSEATSTITDIAPSQNFTASQTGDAQEVMDLIWENEFVKRLLPMCAGFMVVCVVLGIRYKV